MNLSVQGLVFRVLGLGSIGFTWTLKICKITACMAAIMRLGLLSYILLVFFCKESIKKGSFVPTALVSFPFLRV